MFINAIRQRASDIHIEPNEKNVNIRIRIDGNFMEYKVVDLQYRDSIVARIKIMSYLRIDEHRLPQD
ncbi:MAG: Flp pilus assembly complex ATPase component TadA [Candidatus Peribacteria bacterium]|jgi:type IV pilus assembly protein PilB|nr:Flp pilus assembly complex ATPase component TadA [Candidatus Peribacteria bacterium]